MHFHDWSAETKQSVQAGTCQCCAGGMGSTGAQKVMHTEHCLKYPSDIQQWILMKLSHGL